MKDSLSIRTVSGMFAVAIVLVLAAQAAHAAGPGNVYLHLGAADGDDFSSLDTDDALTEFGIGANYLGSGWDAHLELNLFHAEADVIDPVLEEEVTRELTQYGFGVRQYWGDKRMHPDLGVGLGWLKFKNVSSSRGPVSDSTIALWVDGGIDWDIAQGIRVGFQGRVTVSTGIGVESAKHGGGYHLGVRVGWGWGD